MNIKKNIYWLFLVALLAAFILAALILDVISQKNREKNLFNIGNITETSEILNLPAIAAFNEFVFENFDGIEVKTDNTNIYRADSIVEGTNSYPALEKAVDLYDFAVNTNLEDKVLTNDEYKRILKAIGQQDFSSLSLNYFENINRDSTLLEDTKNNMKDYIDFKSIKADGSGYVIDYIDGYESLISADTKNLNWDFIQKSFDKPTNKLPGLKFVDNKNYYIYALTKDISNIDKEKLYNTMITINDQEYRANFEDMEFLDDLYVIKFKLYDGLETILQNRFVNIKLDIFRNRGFIIPKSALVNKDGLDGVYFIDDKVVTFSPIKVLSEDKDNYIVSNSLDEIFPRVLDTSKLNFKTMQAFSKVIIEPEKYNEGQLY